MAHRHYCHLHSDQRCCCCSKNDMQTGGSQAWPSSLAFLETWPPGCFSSCPLLQVCIASSAHILHQASFNWSGPQQSNTGLLLRRQDGTVGTIFDAQRTQRSYSACYVLKPSHMVAWGMLPDRTQGSAGHLVVLQGALALISASLASPELIRHLVPRDPATRIKNPRDLHSL